MKYKRILTGVFAALVVASACSFTDPGDGLLNKIADQLIKWRQTHPQEKVYLQFDKPYYAAGDDMWFKAYVTIGNRHQLSAYSGVLNVDLIDENDSVKRRIKLPVISGLAWGDFMLHDTLKDGNYRVKAYTSWMRNESEDYFFDKTIPIVNAISNKVITKTAYTCIIQSGTQKISAVINYADAGGVPYAGKPVSYEVDLDGQKPIKGKGVTDDKGNLTAAFANTPGTVTTTGHINTSLKLGEDKIVTKVIPVKAVSGKVDVQFFPESGNLVNGIYSRVAFKAVGSDGLGADIKGTVTDDQHKEVIDFSSSHLGMGTFNFEPESGRTYQAVVTYADGSKDTFNLPKAIDNGYVLYIDNSKDDEVSVHILPGKGVVKTDGGLSLIAQSGGELIYAGTSTDNTEAFTKTIPKSKFPSGITQFTLFSAIGEPLNERLVFIQNPDQLKLNISSAKQNYKPREKVTISLNAKNADDKPVIGSFSAAVIDESKVTDDETTGRSIFSSLLLTSDLRGYIENPDYYFTGVNDKTRADLDVLMLTQGYHRFEWKQLLDDKLTPIVYQPERSLTVTGHLRTFGGKPVPNGKVMLFAINGPKVILDTVADANGDFTFNNLVFRDSIRFVVQGRTAKDSKSLDVTIDRVAPQPAGKNINAPDIQVNVNNNLSAYLVNSKKQFDEQVRYGIGDHVHMLNEVTIKAVKKDPFKNSSNRNGPGQADQTFLGNDLFKVGGMNLEQALNGRILGVTLQMSKSGTTVPISNRNNGQMLVILDGFPVGQSMDVFNEIPTSDIQSVEILRNVGLTTVYGTAGNNGVIIVTTKRGDDEDDSSIRSSLPGIVSYLPRGYYRAREFYSPRYDDPKVNTKIQDLRSTIYWAPNLVTDKDGNVSMSFFNADASATYRIIIEGIDGDGNLGRQVYRYKVQ